MKERPRLPRHLPELENPNMESSQSPKSNADRNPAPSGRNAGSSSDAKEPSSQRLVARQLMAALANGNLDDLAQARQAFLGERETAETPSDLEARLERRSRAREMERSLAADDLRKEEEALKQAEQELERRRAEVQAARQKAEADANIGVQEEACRLARAAAEQR